MPMASRIEWLRTRITPGREGEVGRHTKVGARFAIGVWPDAVATVVSRIPVSVGWLDSEPAGRRDP